MQEEKGTEWVPVTLPGGEDRRIYIEAVPHGGREEVGLFEEISFQYITEILTDIARGIGDTLEKAKPKKATVELGVEFGLEGGKLVALIAQGTGKANLKIHLEWDRS